MGTYSEDYYRMRVARIKCEIAGSITEKSCWRCKRILPIEEFAWKEPRNNGRYPACDSCRDPDGLKRCARCDEFKSKAEFHVKAGYLNSYCKPCNSKNGRENTLRSHGLSLGEYESIASAQEGCCAICGKWTEVLHIDHDHSCCPGGKSCGKCCRGLLCIRCNGGLGCFGDEIKSLKNAITYLESWRRSPDDLRYGTGLCSRFQYSSSLHYPCRAL